MDAGRVLLPVLSRGSTASVPALPRRARSRGQPTAQTAGLPPGDARPDRRRRRGAARTVAPSQDGLRPLEGNLTPEEQHAKMMERLDEMSGEPKQQKPGEGRKTNNAKAFSNSRHPDKIHARHLQRRHHCERVIQARKDALDLAKKSRTNTGHR